MAARSPPLLSTRGTANWALPSTVNVTDPVGPLPPGAWRHRRRERDRMAHARRIRCRDHRDGRSPRVDNLNEGAEPEALCVYGLRGDACAKLKQWDQAAADFARACENPSANMRRWYDQAGARLATNDLEGYRRVRSEILSRFARTQSPAAASHLLYVSVVLPAQPDEAETMIRMGNFSISPYPSNPRIRGAANYRAGKYASEIADLNDSAKVFPRARWDWLFLSMAHHQLNHVDEAKQCLKAAIEWIDLANRNRVGGLASPWFSWAEPVEVDHLLREAKALVH